MLSIPEALVLIGPLPPPIHGFSAVNAAVFASLDAGWRVEVLDLAPRGTGVVRRLGVWGSAFRRLRALTGKNQVKRTYIGLSGGWGQILDGLLICMARRGRSEIVIHHHSFAYIDRNSILAAYIFRVAGLRALHVVLSEGMGQALSARYLSVHQWRAVSNAAFFDQSLRSRPGSAELRRIGLLSNLTAAKGVRTFISLLRRLRDRGLAITGVLAGPIIENELVAHIEKAAGEGLLSWEGPVLASGKSEIFAQMDAFVFPSHYRNEADPLVVHEALQGGLPVISTDRGCLADLVAGVGAAFPDGAGWEVSAADLLHRWSSDPAAYQEACAAARARALQLRAKASAARTELFDELTAGIARRVTRGGSL